MDYRKLFKEMEEAEQAAPPKKTGRVLVVDSLNTFLRNFVAIGHLNPTGNHIGGLGGFLKSIGAAIKLLQPTRVILVFDGQGGSTNKRYLYPEYKANRHVSRVSNWDAFDTLEEESDSIIGQIIRLIEYLRCLPVDLAIVDKVEADDVIGYLAQRLEGQVYILSTDQDYLQLVTDKIHVYSPIKKILYTPKRVIEDYGVQPHNFLTYKIVIGDKGDNVPGVKGIQAKTFLKMFPQVETETVVTLEDILTECETKHKKYRDVYNYKHQLLINRQLMDLSNPNIPLEDQETLDELLSNPSKGFNPAKFLNLYKEDQLGKTLLNPHVWLSETFAKLVF